MSSKHVSTESVYPLTSYSQASQQDTAPTLGQPCTKPLISSAHVSACIVSLICLLLAILTILPNLSIAWYLEFSGQIVVIGFLLSVMNLCLQTIVPYTFLLLEARFGQSRLQNFDAIITGKLLASHVSWAWRFAMLFFLALPLALSIAYKRFLGGSSSEPITSEIYYGIDFPRTGTWPPPPNNPIYFLTTSLDAFLRASQYDFVEPPPSDDEHSPRSYGYNTLLLSKNSAAVLDIPTYIYVSKFREQISPGETLDIFAPVHAYLTAMDVSCDFQTNNATWNSDVESALKYADGGLVAVDIFEGTQNVHVGWMPIGPTQAYFGLYPNSTERGGMSLFQDPAVADFELFRMSARKYNFSRTLCHGHWVLDQSSIFLVDGTCEGGQSLDPSIFTGAVPKSLDVMPELKHVFAGCFTDDANGSLKINDPVWLEATYPVVLSTMYWSRALFLLGRSSRNVAVESETLSGYPGDYPADPPSSETIKSTRNTLHSGPFLFLVLAIQPLITIAALITTIWLFNIPLGTEFGLVSILSGFKPSESKDITGAGLSGKLKIPVKLDVTPTSASLIDVEDHGTAIMYRVLDIDEPGTRRTVQNGRVYG